MAKAPGARGRGRPPGAKNKPKGEAAPKKERAKREASADPKPEKRGRAATEKAVSPVKKADVEFFLNNAGRYKDQAAEATGNLGQLVEQFCTNFGFHKKAVAFVRSVHAMYQKDQFKAASLVKDVETLIDVMGYKGQQGLFEQEEDERRDQAVRALNRDDSGGGDDGNGDGAPDPDGDEEDVRPAFLKERDKPASEEAPDPEADEQTASNVRTLRGGIRQLPDAPGTYQKH